MTMECFAYTVEAKFSKDFTFSHDLTEAVEKLQDIYELATQQSEISQAMAYLHGITEWVNAESGKEITLSQAEQFERYVFSEYEQFKKKLPALPKSPTSLSSTQQSSIPLQGADFPPISLESSQSTSSSAETPKEASQPSGS